MKSVIILIGLPGSGKSTWAHERVHKARRNLLRTIIINKDAVREMIHGSYVFDKRDEGIVKGITDAAIKEAIQNSAVREIIIDATHITKKQREEVLNWVGIVSGYEEPKVKYVWFEEKKNNLELRMRSPKGQSMETWAAVIDGMKKSFEPPTLDEVGYAGLKPEHIEKVALWLVR